MQFGSKMFTAMAVAGLAMSPVKAHAAAVGCAGPTYQLGLGGFLSGCWGHLTVSRLFEFAGDVSNVYWLNIGAANVLQPGEVAGNAPAAGSGATFMFNDNCNSDGSTFPGKFCNVNGGTQPFGLNWNTPGNGELQFGLADPQGWVYSGNTPSRNQPPAPGGLQEVLLRVTGIDANDHFLMGWEDRNTGCLTKALTAQSSGVIVGDASIAFGSLTDANLSIVLNACTSAAGGGTSDSDFNDFYMMIDAETLGIPTDVSPEPMTMTLLATGLAGLGGASLRRRRNKKS